MLNFGSNHCTMFAGSHWRTSVARSSKAGEFTSGFLATGICWLTSVAHSCEAGDRRVSWLLEFVGRRLSPISVVINFHCLQIFLDAELFFCGVCLTIAAPLAPLAAPAMFLVSRMAYLACEISLLRLALPLRC